MTDDRPASTADSEQRDLADRVIRDLLELRAAVYATDVATTDLHCQRTADQGRHAFAKSAAGVSNARADVWLAVSAPATTIKQKPNPADLDRLWSVAAAKGQQNNIGVANATYGPLLAHRPISSGCWPR